MVVAQDGVVTLVAQWWGIPYIDANGAERTCTDYTVITNATGNVRYGEYGGEAWYVVNTDVTISGQLRFNDHDAHLILCDGATLTVTNTNDNSEAIGGGSLTIYGQANGTGAVVANGDCGIAVGGSVTINGGTVTATAKDNYGIAGGGNVTINGGTVTANGGEYGNGIFANNGSITINGGTVTAESGPDGIGICAPAHKGSIILGWTNPTDSITASSYHAGGSGGVRVKDGQRLTDGSNIYEVGLGASALKGKTLRPYIYTPTYPAYLGLPDDPADDTTEESGIRAKYDVWAARYGYDASGVSEAAYLLNIAPWETPIELRIAGIEVGSAGATIRVTCRAGASAEAEAGAVNLALINGVFAVEAGDDLGALAPKAVPAADVTYENGEATIFVPSSAGRFVKAVIGLTAPEEGE